MNNYTLGEPKDREKVQRILDKLTASNSKKIEFYFMRNSYRITVTLTNEGTMLCIPISFIDKPELEGYLAHEICHEKEDNIGANFYKKLQNIVDFIKLLYIFIIKDQTQIETDTDMRALELLAKNNAKIGVMEDFLNAEINRANISYSGIRRFLLLRSLKKRLKAVQKYIILNEVREVRI